MKIYFMLKNFFILTFFLTSTLYLTAEKNKKLSQEQIIALVQKFEKNSSIKEVELVNLKDITVQLKKHEQHVRLHQKQLTD